MLDEPVRSGQELGVGVIRDYLQILVAPLILGVILVPDEGSNRIF